MSFACPHFQPDTDTCLRLQTDCVPGRPGCAIAKTTRFAVPWEERLRDLQEEKRRQALAALLACASAPQPGQPRRPR